jgi:hypothetical protein
MRKRFGMGDGGFVDIGFAGFFGSSADKLIFVLEVGVGFSNSDISNVYVWASVCSRMYRDVRREMGLLGRWQGRWQK